MNETPKQENSVPNYPYKVDLIDSVRNCSGCFNSRYGLDFVKGKTYKCTKCLPDGDVCEYCYYHCHKDCYKEPKKSTNSYFFACDCALELHHKVFPSPFDADDEDEKAAIEFKTREEKEKILLEYLKTPEFIKRDFYLSNVGYLHETCKYFVQNEKDKRIIYYKNPKNEKFYVSYCNIIYEKLFHFDVTIDEILSAVKWGLLYDYKASYDMKMVNRIFSFWCMLIHFDYISKYFQNVKSLTVNDFLNCSFTELLAYRELIHTKNQFCAEAQNFINSHKIKDMITSLSDALVKFDSIYANDFLCFVLQAAQYMLLDIEDIEYIVKSYFSVKIEKEGNISNQVLLVDAFFVLGKTYEMLLFEEYHNKGKSERCHLFYNNLTGKKIFMMMVIASTYTTSPKMNYENLKKINHLFFYPFNDKQREFDVNEYDTIKRMIKETNIESKKEIVYISNKICELRNEYDASKETNEKVQQFASLLNDLVNYLTSKIKTTDTVMYRNNKHFRVVKKVTKFFIKKDSLYIENIDEIINELIYVNIDTAIAKMILALIYNNQENKDIFNSDEQTMFIETAMNILNLFLLTEKGLHYFTTGESCHYLILAKDIAFSCGFYNSFNKLSSFLCLLPKRVIERPIYDTQEKIKDDVDKETQIQFLKELRKIYSNESYALNFFSEIMNDFLKFITDDFTKEKFFDIALNKEKSSLSTEERNDIKLLIAYIDLLSMNVNPMREECYIYYQKCFEFFEHPKLEELFRTNFLSMRKKRVIIHYMTVYSLLPVYTDCNVEVFPLSNPLYAEYNRDYIHLRHRTNEECSELPLVAEEISKSSKKMIEKKIAKHQRIVKLLDICGELMIKIPNTYNVNSKEYFQLQSLFKTVINTIKLTTNFVYYRRLRVSQLFLFSFAKLVVMFIEREFILFNLFGLKNEGESIDINDIDPLSFKSIAEASIKQFAKFSSLFASNKFKSVYSLYMNNNKDDLFYDSDTPFSFLTEKQEHNPLFEVDAKYNEMNKNFEAYKEMTVSQIEDEKEQVIFSALKNNTSVEEQPFMYYFFKFMFDNYLNSIFPFAPEVVNIYYKVCANDLDYIDEKIENRDLIVNFFDKIKKILPSLLNRCYYESSIWANTVIDNRDSFAVVSLIKFIELFGEGYNYNFHEDIIKDAHCDELMSFEKPPQEIEMEKEDEEEEGKKTVKRKEIILKETIKSKYDPNLDDCDNTCIPAKNKKTIFEIVVQNLNLNLFKVFKGYLRNAPIPIESNLLIVINAEIDFLIEFLYTFNYQLEELISNSLHWLFFEKCYYRKTWKEYMGKVIVDRKELCFIEKRLIDLLISFLSSSKNEAFAKNLNSGVFFKEMLLHYDALIESLNGKNKALYDRITKLNEVTNEEEYKNTLIDFYVWEEEFREEWHMSMIINYIKLLSLLENKYHQKTVRQTLENQKNQNDKDYIKNQGLYNFLNTILINIEFSYVLSDNEKEHYLSKEENERIKDGRKQERLNSGVKETALDVMRRCLQVSTDKKEDTKPEDAAQEKYGTTFYILPYYTYYLTNQSKIRFEENVDRTSKGTKTKGLITYIESFIFEMIVNMHMFKQNTKRAQFISKFNYFTFELINFAFICIHNMILLFHYYKSRSLDPIAYETLDTNEFNSLFDNNNWLFAAVQFIFLGFVITVWYKYNYIQCYFNNLQIKFESKEPLFKRLKKFQRQLTCDNPDFYNLINKHFEHVPYSEKWKVAILDSFFLNSEICILIYTFILLLLYFIFHSPLFLVIPILFLAHIFDTLSAIFKGVYSRFGHLFAVYIFTYLTIYIFMWTGFLFFSDLFKVDTINAQNEPVATEPFCTSSIQCLLYFINYGIRSGGGVGDLLGTPSFKDDYWFFMKIFFYEILFHLIIVMIFANVFLGLIADAFGELREAAEVKSNDKENICFICQINSDDCANKGIDFEEHIMKKHNLWDYINFLCYLYLKDENEYNLMEYKIMSSISEFNLSWIPTFENEDED